MSLPFRSWFKTAVGPLGWTPAVFWVATVTEYMDAIDAWNAMHGKDKGAPPSDAEMGALLAKYG